MDIVLGVSMTPTTVRMVLVEGEKADGITVDNDVFEVAAAQGSANSAAQVVSAVLGTRESAQANGYHLKSIGVTWSDHSEAAALRDALAVDGIDDVMLVSEGHAAAALARAVGRAVGYDTTALLFVNRDTASLSVVQTDDGSVVQVLSRTLHSADAMAVLAEMAMQIGMAVAAHHAPPQGLFVVGSGVDVSAVKARLEHLVSIPVNAPEDADLALARGAALASASGPTFEASTSGLAYSKDPDGAAAGSAFAGLAGAETQLAAATDQPVDDMDDVVDEYAHTEARPVEEERKPFLLVGSALTSVFVIGVVALAISLAVNIRPTADQRPSPAESIIMPSSQVPTPVQEARQPVDPPPAETIKPPVPVVQQAPAQTPRTVFVEAPAPAAPAPAPVAPAPAPAVAPPVVAPPVVVPPPVIVPPQPQWQWPDWTQWTPPDTSMWPSNESQDSQFPQSPQQPQEPQQPQVPQQPQEPGGGSGSDSGSGGSGSSGSGSGSDSSGSGSSGSGSSGSGSDSGGSASGSGGSGSSGSSSSGSGASTGGSGSSSSPSSSSGGTSSGGSSPGGGSGVSSPSSGSTTSSGSSGSSAVPGSSSGSPSSGGSGPSSSGSSGGDCLLDFCSSG